jgi:HEPN domain-containing protein
MSVDKQTHEAGRWLETAEEDLEAARVLLREGKYYFQKDAEFCIRVAESILAEIRNLFEQ